MNQYTYFVLGILLGLGIAVYFGISREEKIIKQEKKTFSTEKLDNAMESIVEKITTKIRELKRELTEEEKNQIIEECCKEKFGL